MTLADLDLAQRLAAVPGIWRAGMADTMGRRVLAARDGMCLCAWYEGPSGAEQPRMGWVRFEQMAPIDFDDGPTRGALLDVAREMWVDPSIYLAPCTEIRPDGTSPVWFVYTGRGRGPIGYAPTEGAAIAAAILAAPALSVTTTPPPAPSAAS